MGDDRDAILARRRRLIALALAGGTLTTACGPTVCLSPREDPEDAGADASDVADAGPDAETDAP